MLPPGETPAAVAVQPPPAATPAIAEAPAAPAPVTDPVLVAVRDRLAKPLPGVDKADMAALVAFYAVRTEGPVWTRDGTFTAKAQAAMTAIRAADDWGLESEEFSLPTLPASADTTALADADVQISRAILKYARQASGGRVDPATLSRFNDLRGTFANPSTVLTEIASASEPDAYLEALHPAHDQFHKLRDLLVKARHGGPSKPEPIAAEPAKLVLSATASIKPGATHPDVALIRAHLGVPATAGSEAVYDKPLVAAVKAFQQERGLQVSGTIGASTRTALTGGAPQKKPATPDPAKDLERIVMNMERWRWLPANMGRFHILNNVPEFATRVVKDAKVIHQEKIIVGKNETPTSVFSANMQFVIFHPEWGVPDSIKVKEIWPSLRRKTQDDDFFGFGGGGADTRILQRQNLRVSQNGRVVDARQIDWNRVDPRAYQFIQSAGGANVLGVVKFRFPNRHDIYMHDTPNRDLFGQTVRAFSHGCVRVNNPRRLAEIILAEDRGWTPERVGQSLAGSATQEIKLERQFPVHVTYFTARVDDDGKLRTFNDLYGHDVKLAAALAGKPIKLEDPTPLSTNDVLAQTTKPNKKGGQAPKAEASLGGFLDGLFGN